MSNVAKLVIAPTGGFGDLDDGGSVIWQLHSGIVSYPMKNLWALPVLHSGRDLIR